MKRSFGIKKCDFRAGYNWNVFARFDQRKNATPATTCPAKTTPLTIHTQLLPDFFPVVPIIDVWHLVRSAVQFPVFNKPNT